MKYMKKSLAILLALVMCLSFIPLVAIADGDIVVIDLYSFNDFHGTVDKSASGSNPGADRFVALVQELMKDNPNSAILAAGDNYQGSPLSNVFYGEPVSAMFKYLGIKYSALGNHEYDWGIEYIYKFIEDGDVTFLAANVFYEGTRERPDYCEPYAILEFDGVKVGLIGLITVETPTLVKAEMVEGLVFEDPAIAVAELEPFLRSEGCDIVIGLTHLPAFSSNPDITPEAIALAETAAGAKLDGIFGGHAHSHVDRIVNGVPVLSAGFNGRGLARLSFEFDKAAGAIVNVETKVFLQNDMNLDTILPNVPLQVNAEITAIIAKYNADIGPLFAKAVGVYGEPIRTRNDQADWGTRVVWEYIFEETGENYVLLQNAGGWRDTSPYNRRAGDFVTLGYLYTLMPFDNEIVLMDMKGSDLLADLLNVPDAELGSAKCVAGAYEKDGKWFLTTTDEEILDDDTIYKVSCNDFMLTGGDRYNFTNAIDATFMGVPLRDAMIIVLMNRIELTEQIDPPYRDDIDVDQWYMEAYEFANGRGLIDGISLFEWAPELAATRGTVFEAFYRFEGSPAVTGDNFPDVKADDFYFNAALWAKNTGISQGSEGSFLGDTQVTRTQLAAIFVRYLDYAGHALEPVDLSSYPDVGEIQAWAVEEEVLAKIVGTGIIKGQTTAAGLILAPEATARRCELAQMLMNLDEYIDDLDYAVGRVDNIPSFGNLNMAITGSALFAKGFAIGDILTVKVGDTVLEAPFAPAYGDVDIGDPVVRLSGGSATAQVIIALNMGDFAGTYDVSAGDLIYFTLSEKGAYLEELELRSIERNRTLNRDDYESDQVFGNYREVAIAGIAPGVLFRSSSPIDTGLRRASYVDAFIEEVGIATVVNMANTEEIIEAFIAAEDFDSPYYASLYEAGQVISLNMGVAFMEATFAEKLKLGFEFMLDNDGPYLIHCTEGKDRVGFIFALLEALMGATVEEIVEDYMITYENYFFVEKDSVAYERFADRNVLLMLRFIAGLEKDADLDDVDLADAANGYLLDVVGLTQAQIDALTAILSGVKAVAAAA